MKRGDKRAILFGFISVVIGYFLASITFYFSRLYNISLNKNLLATSYVLLIGLFAFLFYFINFKRFVYTKKIKNKKINAEAIKFNWDE